MAKGCERERGDAREMRGSVKERGWSDGSAEERGGARRLEGDRRDARGGGARGARRSEGSEGVISSIVKCFHGSASKYMYFKLGSHLLLNFIANNRYNIMFEIKIY